MTLTDTSKDALIKEKGTLLRTLDEKKTVIAALTGNLRSAQGDYDQTLERINDIHADLGLEPYSPKEETQPIPG